MSSPRTIIAAKTSTEALRSHLVFTLGRLRRHPLTQGHLAPFQELIAQVDAVDVKAKALSDEVDEAQVDIYVADDGLNEFAGTVWKVVDSITKEADAPLRKLLFAGKNLSDFSRPILGNQYTIMTDWSDLLAKSEHAGLQGLSAEAEKVIQAAIEALGRKAAADANKKVFREVGERAKLFAAANAARKKLHGELSALALEHPGLPATFADRFFRREPAAESAEEALEPTMESVQEEIQRLKEQLAAQEALLKTLAEKAKAEALDAETRKAAEARLQELEQEDALRAKEKEALLAKLGKK